MAQISETVNNTSQEMTPPKSKKKLLIIMGVLAIILIGVLFYIVLHWGEENTDNASFEAHVVSVAPRVAGYVTKLNVTDNQQVHKGDVLAQIDDRPYKIAVERNMAIVAGAKSDLDLAKLARERFEKLGEKARSKQDFDNAIAAELRAQSQYDLAVANLSDAQINLDDTRIVAIMDGRITERAAEVGAYMQPGQRLFSLVATDLWVVANFKETQLTKMKPGQRVDIEVDAYPDYKMTGKIDSVQSGTGARFSLFPAENATGNFVKIIQRVPVKIILDKQPEAQYALAPGMSVKPVVHTAE